MKKFAYLLAFLFVAFLFSPTVIALIDRNVDLSIAYNLNEEESSSKNQISLEYTIEELVSNFESYHFLQTSEKDAHYYKECRYTVFLSTTSPPPKLA